MAPLRFYLFGAPHAQLQQTPVDVNRRKALALLRFLTAADQQLEEARHGVVPVRKSVMARIKSEATVDDWQRWETVERVIQEQILIPPKFARYPVVEEVLWTTVQAAITGQLEIDTALHNMTEHIRNIVRGEHVS